MHQIYLIFWFQPRPCGLSGCGGMHQVCHRYGAGRRSRFRREVVASAAISSGTVKTAWKYGMSRSSPAGPRATGAGPVRGTWGSSDCGRNCTRCAVGRSRRNARCGRRARQYGKPRSRPWRDATRWTTCILAITERRSEVADHVRHFRPLAGHGTRPSGGDEVRRGCCGGVQSVQRTGGGRLLLYARSCTSPARKDQILSRTESSEGQAASTLQKLDDRGQSWPSKCLRPRRRRL